MDTHTDKISTNGASCTDDVVNALLCRGEMSLLTGNISGLELFEQAATLKPSDPLLFYRQGLSLFEYGNTEGKEKILHLAGKKFKSAVKLDPSFFEAWQGWGNVLFLLSTIYEEHHYTRDALEKYQQAIVFSIGQSSDILADLHWDYGVIWKRMGEKSQEGVDFQRALDAFQKASSLNEELPSEFWYNYGQTCLMLCLRINDVRLCVKAINCFKHALSKQNGNCIYWKSMANASVLLYAHTHDDDHFIQTSDAFASAVNCCPQDVQVWFEWAEFLCQSGRRSQDAKRLRLSIEKCQMAYTCDPGHAKTIAIWAESLALLGALSDRIDFIHEAQNKISEAENLDPNDLDVLYSSGMCLASFAKYFNDLDYYCQAIEKFQQGLSLDRTQAKLWHGLALTYATIGDLTDEVDAYHKAHRFFLKALALLPSTYTLFDYALSLFNLGELSQNPEYLNEAVVQFERALNIQKNALYLHPHWLFHYARALDLLGDFYEEESYYLRAIEIFSHVLTVDPDCPEIHYRLALSFSHLGDLLDDVDNLYRAIHHYRLASKRDEENDQIIADWGLTLMNIADHCSDSAEAVQFFKDAESKLTIAAKLGNLQVYYHLGCLYSLLGQYEKAMTFICKADQFDALPPLEQLHNDDWLDGLRSTHDFREFLS